MRRFKLINSRGAEFDLMSKSAFFHVPDGLGFSMSSEYMRIGASYQLISTNAEQKVVSGTMVFADYATYSDFAQFIVYTPLRLAYKPGTEWAYLDCDVSRLDKSEISNTNGRLNCNIDFTASSKWYIPRLARRTAVDIVDAKRYSYSYNYTYAEAINGIINIDNASSEESPTIISIMGTITNPTWVLVVNNQVVQSGSVNATIPAGNKLIINSKDNALEIAEYVANSNTFVRNLYQASNFTLDNFIYVPPGRSTLRISGEVSGAIDAWIEIEEIHETV